MAGRPLRTVLLLLMVVALIPGQAYGAGPEAGEPTGGAQVQRVSQQDRDGDGRPDLTVIDSVIATPYDRVLVYDGARNMRASSKWEDATDFTDDTWVFDVGGGGGTNRATIIIAFTTEGSDTLARIYDGTVTGGVVRYEVAGTSVRATEPAYPSMIIRARGQWLDPGGTLNYNLIWQYDGPAADREMAKRYPSTFVLDGNPDSQGEARDSNHDGVPEYLWRTLLAPVPSSERIPRAGIQANSGRHRPSALTNVVFWPLLNLPDDPQGRNYFDTPLFIGVDWRSGLIGSLTFAGYPTEEGYHVNTLSPLKPRQVNVLSFENPMAYYDLAGDQDGRPELFIRLAYTPPGDAYYATGGPTRSPIEMVQYSWNQRNHDALRWDYKIDLAGRNALGSTVTLGDIVIEQVPHAELPHWVVTHPWAFATFVAYESGDGYLSSEGIYDWSTLEGVQRYEGIYAGSTLAGVGEYTGSDINSVPDSTQIQRDYVAGAASKPPEDLYQSILVGFRGEYADVNGEARLYFSPIDARLHLAGATRGVYNIGNRRRVEYRNLDGDEFIDSWQLYSGNQITAQLSQARGFVIYGGDGQVGLSRVAVPRERFRTQPPTSHDDWARLGELIDANRRDFAAGDLHAMFRQIDGTVTEISNASLSDYRPLGQEGFRFVLDLEPGFQVEGADELETAKLTPGRYAVTYDGNFVVRPLTPPSISAKMVDATLQQLEPGSLQVLLRNDGLQDAPQATMEIWAAPPQGQAKLISTQTLALLAETSTTAKIAWAPPYAGEWSIAPQIYRTNGQRITYESTSVTVLPTTAASPEGLVTASSSPTALPFAILGLIGFAAIAAMIVWRAWATAAVGKVSDAAE